MVTLKIMGYPLVELVLYFFVYAAAGWAMETVYCSLKERRFVARGFLHGPMCPIYGVGVLLMLLFFAPFANNLFVFYIVSTITMSAWEYFVAWFLETTTHIKYWDYSEFRFNLKGRICLQVCLTWGALSYVAVFWIHPPVAALVESLSLQTQTVAACALLAVLAVDAAVTIHQLALVTVLMHKLEALGGELQTQLAAGKAELGERMEQAKVLYNDLLAAAEQRSRRLRRAYSGMTSKVFSGRLEEVKQVGAGLAARLKEAQEKYRATK